MLGWMKKILQKIFLFVSAKIQLPSHSTKNLPTPEHHPYLPLPSHLREVDTGGTNDGCPRAPSSSADTKELRLCKASLSRSMPSAESPYIRQQPRHREHFEVDWGLDVGELKRERGRRSVARAHLHPAYSVPKQSSVEVTEVGAQVGAAFKVVLACTEH